jgi:hypothetical protein
MLASRKRSCPTTFIVTSFICLKSTKSSASPEFNILIPASGKTGFVRQRDYLSTLMRSYLYINAQIQNRFKLIYANYQSVSMSRRTALNTMRNSRVTYRCEALSLFSVTYLSVEPFRLINCGGGTRKYEKHCHVEATVPNFSSVPSVQIQLRTVGRENRDRGAVTP